MYILGLFFPSDDKQPFRDDIGHLMIRLSVRSGQIFFMILSQGNIIPRLVNFTRLLGVLCLIAFLFVWQELKAAPPPGFDYTADKTEICVGDTVTFTITKSPPPTDYFIWVFGPGADPDTITTGTGTTEMKVVYTVPGTYSDTIYYYENSLKYKTYQNHITVNPLPYLLLQETP